MFIFTLRIAALPYPSLNFCVDILAERVGGTTVKTDCILSARLLSDIIESLDLNINM